MVGAGAAWLVALALLMWETCGGPAVAGRWALYLAAAAATWSVIIAQARCRRRMVAAMARELEFSQRDRDGDGLRPVP